MPDPRDEIPRGAHPCTDCGVACGDYWNLRVRCGPCQYRFDAEVRDSHGGRREIDAAVRAARVPKYAARAAAKLPLFEDD